ncbi:MAG: alpha/beta fold hydrolase [Chloroflexi bacterium]|nr:alpha/beta fold hydrolase [Chloroflexota bacterium]
MNVNDVELNVKISGAETGIPFIWGHGLMSSMAAEDTAPWIRWNQMSDLIKLVRYDARGHGQSGMSEALPDYHWSALAQDMLALADQVGFETFIAGGQSMGCATSMYAALAAPERIKGLVLMNVPTAWETRAAQAGFYGQMADLIEARGIDTLLAMMEQQAAAMPSNWQMDAFPEAAASFGERFRKLDPKALATTLRGAQLTDLPSPEALEAIHAPALILAWTDDPGHPVSSAEIVHERIQDSQLLIAHNASEVFTWTNAIRDFVTGLA